MELKRFLMLLLVTFCMTFQFNCQMSYVDTYEVVTKGEQIMENKNYDFNFNFASKINSTFSDGGNNIG